MSALSIQVPFPVFQGRDGQPLENGYVWIGEPNLNPQTNPVVVYFDAALTIVAAQPLRTLNGYVSRAGTPAQIYVDANNFSILVQDSNGSMIYSFPQGTGIEPVPNNASGIVYDPAGTGAVPTTVQTKLRETVSVKDFGAVGDGVTDDYQAFVNAIATNKLVQLQAKTYYLGSTLTIVSGAGIVGQGPGLAFPTANKTFLKFPVGINGVVIQNNNTFNSKYESFGIASTATVAGTGVGLTLSANGVNVKYLTVTGFASHGVQITSSFGLNANSIRLEHIRSYLNKGDGYRIGPGSDINNCTFDSLTSVANNGWGYYVEGAAKSTFINPLADANTAGGYYDGGNSSVYFYPYSESGSGSAFYLAPGSSHGSVFQNLYAAVNITYSSIAVLSSWNIIQRNGFVRQMNIWQPEGPGGAGNYYQLINDGASLNLINATTGKLVFTADNSATRVLTDYTWAPLVTSTYDLGLTNRRWKNAYIDNTVLAPPNSNTPASNGQMVFELTSNTQLTVKVRGSDGVVRSSVLTLS